MITVSGGFKTKLESQASHPRYRLLFYKDVLTANTIAFLNTNPDTITDSGNRFVAAGFLSGDEILVSGSDTNNGSYTIDTVVAGTITLVATDTLVADAAGDVVTIAASRATYGSYIESVSLIKRDAELTCGTATVKVVNTDQTWNMFESNPRILGKTARLQLYFSGDSEYMTLFTGTVEKAEFKGSSVILYIRDKMYKVLKTRLGSGEIPVTFADLSNPADIVWRILTHANYGNLDGLTDVKNVDINYGANAADPGGWLAWKAWTTSTYTALEVRFPGTTVQAALLAIARQSNSYIWVNNEGKFSFSPLYDTSVQAFDLSNCHYIDLTPSVDDLLVRYVQWYDRDFGTDIWVPHPPLPWETNPYIAEWKKITADTIAFHENAPAADTITDTDSGFVNAGFEAGDRVVVSGSAMNNNTFTIGSVVAGTITLISTDDLTAAIAGPDITIRQADFDIVEYIDELKIVTHRNYNSAMGCAEYKVADYADPIKWVFIHATMKGYLTEIGDEVSVTESLKGLSNDTVRIVEITSLNLIDGTVLLMGLMPHTYPSLSSGSSSFSSSSSSFSSSNSSSSFSSSYAEPPPSSSSSSESSESSESSASSASSSSVSSYTG